MILDPDAGVVADTQVIIYLLSGDLAHAELAEQYRPHLQNRPIAISFQTHAELLVAQEVQQWERIRFLTLISELEVVPWSPELLNYYVRARAAAYEAWKSGTARKIDAADGWVAATALAMNRPLVTHDDKLSKSPLNQIITELRE